MQTCVRAGALWASKLRTTTSTRSSSAKTQRASTAGSSTRQAPASWRPNLQVVDGVVQSIKLITKDASERIASFAFAHARAIGRPNVTVVHKATIMRASDGLFLEEARRTAERFPEIEYSEISLDRACLQVTRDLRVPRACVCFLGANACTF